LKKPINLWPLVGEVVAEIIDSDGVRWTLNVGGRSDAPQSSQLSGNLLEAWKLFLFHSNVKAVGGEDGQSFEISNSHSTSNIEEDDIALEQGVGVVQLNGWVSH